MWLLVVRRAAQGTTILTTLEGVGFRFGYQFLPVGRSRYDADEPDAYAFSVYATSYTVCPLEKELPRSDERGTRLAKVVDGK